MLNFKDVLRQRGESYGALWCDEGVYSIAKEVQLLRPELFDDIFLGLGPFHMEKIVMACLGSFLQCVGVDVALAESNVFGVDVVKSKVITGKHYIKSKEGMELVADAMSGILFDAFKTDPSFTTDDQLLEDYESAIHNVLDCLENKDMDDLRMQWEHTKVLQEEVVKMFDQWKTESRHNENVQYWCLFLEEIYPILQGLTYSIRSGNWELFLGVLNQSMPLFFAFGRTNYSRWTPLFLEDCLDLPRKMPDLYKHFKQGGWVTYFTTRKCSAVGMDMGLEKVYNKPAKGIGGIIGMTSRKEAVAQWNVLKHEKDLHVANMLDWTHLSVSKDKDSELNLHHEFTENSAVRSNKRVQEFVNYLELVGGPFELSDRKLRNICNGSTLASNVAEGILGCLEVGKSSFESYKQERLVEKSKSIHDKIPSNKGIVVPTPVFENPLEKPFQSLPIKSKQDISDARRFIEAARDRGCSSVEDILRYEITSTSYFLLSETKEGLRLKNSEKAEMARDMFARFKSAVIIGSPIPMTDIVIFDFMALVRKVPMKKLKLKTYDDLARHLHDSILKQSSHASRIDIIYDIYCVYSTKHCERVTRGNSSSSITVSIKSDAQNLPVNLELFWNSMENKTALQTYFYQWMLKTYMGDKSIFFGGLKGGYCFRINDGEGYEVPELFSSQEEADERISFHINHANMKDLKKVLVVSPDTDVLVCLIYHVQETWHFEELYLRLGSGKSKKFVAIHEMAKNIRPSLVQHFPSYHALTGCDTTSKVGAKLSCFTKSLNLELLNGFGEQPLTEEMIISAEKFLLQTLHKHRDAESFDEYRYAQYHDMNSLDFRKLVCCSSTIHEHIKRAHHQVMRWKNSAQPPPSFPDPADGFGYEVRMGLLLPILVPGLSRPANLPNPCKCKNCTRSTCSCRKANLKCCSFCKCGKDCKNPI